MLDDFAVGELWLGAGGVGEKFCGEVAGDLIGIGEQEALVVFDRGEGFAIMRDAAFFDIGSAVEGAAGVAGKLHDAGLGAGGGAVEVAVAADRIKGLEREAGRVDVLMAGIARGDVAMLVELLADRGRAADVGLDGGHVRRRWWRGLADDVLEHPLATQHGRGGRAIGGDLQHAALRHHATTMRACGEVHAAEFGLRDGGGE